MRVSYHEAVATDVTRAQSYFREVSGEALSAAFYDELRSLESRISVQPTSFHFDPSGLRRANFKRFRYHLLFEAGLDEVKIWVVRHDKRHPSFGLTRYKNSL